jgi:hypothetical protein
MNASKDGSAATASKKRQMGKRSAGGGVWRARQAGVPPSSANGMGVGISLSCAPARAPPSGRETTRSLLAVTAEVWAAWLSQTKSRPCSRGRQFW